MVAAIPVALNNRANLRVFLVMRLALSLAVLTACGGSGDRTYSLDELPVLEWTSGIPVHGNGKLVVSSSLVAPRDWSTVKGHAIFTCDDCTLGDDRAHVLPDLAPGGVEIGRIALGRVDARADFADGRMHLSSALRSDDFELDAEVDAVLAQNTRDTRLDGCIRFRALDALKTRDPKLYSLVETMTGNPSEDGLFAITISGTLGAIRAAFHDCDLERYRSSAR